MVMIHVEVLIMSGIITMIYNHRNHGYDAYWGVNHVWNHNHDLQPQESWL